MSYIGNNELFIEKVASSEGRDKTAAVMPGFIRDHLREVAFNKKIIPPRQVTRADCQVSVNHDTLVKIVELEPKSRGMVMTFRGEPTTRIISAPRLEVPFFTISSEKHEKTEQELLAYSFPITKVIEGNIEKDMGEVEDREWLLHVEAAIQAVQEEVNGGATPLHVGTIGTTVEKSVIKGELARSAVANTTEVLPLQRPDLVNLHKLHSLSKLVGVIDLMPEFSYQDINQWTVNDLGDTLTSETARNGWSSNTIIGRRFVRSIKHDILRPGNIYSFTAPEFMGVSYILNNPKFYIDKKANVISFQSWEDIGMSLVNIEAPKKLELYSADASNADADTLRSNFIPVAEEELGAMNNKVDEGLTFPHVHTY